MFNIKLDRNMEYCPKVVVSDDHSPVLWQVSFCPQGFGG